MPAPKKEQRNKSKIIRLIRHYAYDYGYSLSKVAELAAIGERTFYSRMKSPGKFSLDELNRIARALHIPRADLEPVLLWHGG